MESNEYTFYIKVVASFEVFHLMTLICLKNNIKFQRLSKMKKTTFKTSPRLKIERFRELKGQSYPVLEFEVKIQTLTRVGGGKLGLTLTLITRAHVCPSSPTRHSVLELVAAAGI
jgi:hypothetical protein